MKKVSGPQVVTPEEALERPLPAEIQETLGELVGSSSSSHRREPCVLFSR